MKNLTMTLYSQSVKDILAAFTGFFSFNLIKYKFNDTSIERNLNGHLETVAVKSIRLLMGGFDSVSAFRQRLKGRAQNSHRLNSQAVGSDS